MPPGRVCPLPGLSTLWGNFPQITGQQGLRGQGCPSLPTLAGPCPPNKRSHRPAPILPSGDTGTSALRLGGLCTLSLQKGDGDRLSGAAMSWKDFYKAPPVWCSPGPSIFEDAPQAPSTTGSKPEAIPGALVSHGHSRNSQPCCHTCPKPMHISRCVLPPLAPAQLVSPANQLPSSHWEAQKS